MSFWDLIILSVIQGVAEFLPISSSGHLVLIGQWLGVGEAQGSLNIMLHAGTLMSIIVFYFFQVIKLIRSDRRVIPLLIVGTLPAVAIGLSIELFFPELKTSPLLAASMLLVTGGILLATRWIKEGDQVYEKVSYRGVLIIGLFQAIAILPGISRSGSTIFAGQWVGLKRESAGTFSFLLAIPVLAGATVLELAKILKKGDQADVSIGMLLLGAAISFVVGYFSLWLLVRFIQRGKFHWFAWWCIPFGLISLAILLFWGQAA